MLCLIRSNITVQIEYSILICISVSDYRVPQSKIMSNDASKWTDKQIADMLAVFHAGEQNQELEIRINVTRNAFESIYAALMAAYAAGDTREPQLNRTINFISRSAVNEQTSGIRTNNYETSPAESSYLSKTELVRSVMVRTGFLPYIVSLSAEVPTGPEPVSISALVRFKARLSFETVGKPWRYDITAIRSGKFNEMSAIIRDIRDNFLPRNMTAENFLQTIDHGNADAYEVEIEYIGENKDLTGSDITAVVNDLFTMIAPKFGDDMVYQEQIYHVATWILGKEAAEVYRKPTHRLKRLLNDTIAMSKNTYMEIWPPAGWFLTDKADGRRTCVIVSGKQMHVLLSDKMMTYECPQLMETTIGDCELIGDPTGKYNLHVFDMMVLNNHNHSADGFEIRDTKLEEVAKIISDLLPVDCTSVVKHYERLGDDPADYERVFRKVYGAEYSYELDGLVLVRPGDGYNDTLNYKWKPLMQNTIDFVAIKCPQSLLGMTPYINKPGKTLYLLCVGLSSRARDMLGIPVLNALKSVIECTNTRGYCPVQFSPSANSMAYLWWVDAPTPDMYDRKIVELVQNPDAKDLTEQWMLVKVRTDRFMEDNYYGNDYRTAESIYMNYVDPFHLEALWTPPASYFTRESTDVYHAANRFKRLVIMDVFKKYLVRGSKIIDLAGGRGADLNRYESLGIAHALFIDIDASAIAELIRRKFTLLTKRGGDDTDAKSLRGPYDFNKRFTKSNRTTIHTLVADLASPYEDLIVSTYQYGYNEKTVTTFVCNFAIHYLCGSEQTIANLFKFIAAMSMPGATFIFTTMDGSRVFDILKDVSTDEIWSSAEPLNDGDTAQIGPKKYAIRKKYTGAKLATFGQTIEVYLSFADKFVAEPLCNVSAVIAVAKKLGFALELSESMAEWFSGSTRNELSAVDKEYIGLHQIVVLKYMGKK